LALGAYVQKSTVSTQGQPYLLIWFMKIGQRHRQLAKSKEPITLTFVL